VLSADLEQKLNSDPLLIVYSSPLLSVEFCPQNKEMKTIKGWRSLQRTSVLITNNFVNFSKTKSL